METVIEIKPAQLNALLQRAAEMAIAMYDKKLRQIYISKVKAIRRYGKANVERWIEDGKVNPKRTGKTPSSTIQISLAELENAKEQENAERNIYL